MYVSCVYVGGGLTEAGELVSQFGILPAERISTLEFNRRLFTTLGVKNGQLYELRLQTPESKVAGFQDTLQVIQRSLKLYDLDR